LVDFYDISIIQLFLHLIILQDIVCRGTLLVATAGIPMLSPIAHQAMIATQGLVQEKTDGTVQCLLQAVKEVRRKLHKLSIIELFLLFDEV
jgi:hypothetical protein